MIRSKTGKINIAKQNFVTIKAILIITSLLLSIAKTSLAQTITADLKLTPQNQQTTLQFKEIGQIPKAEQKKLTLTLRSDQDEYTIGKKPSLWLDAKNNETIEKQIPWSAEGLTLIFDNVEYIYGIKKKEKIQTIYPGEELKNLHIVPSRSWRNALDNTALPLTIGSHTIQIIHTNDATIKSNTITINISDKKTKPTSKDASETTTLQIQNDEIIQKDTTIYPGVGLQKVHLGDSTEKMQQFFGSPSREQKFTNGGVSIYYQDGTIRVWSRRQTIREFYFRRGYNGSLPNGIKLDDSLDDVMKHYDEPIKTKEILNKDRNSNFSDQILYTLKSNDNDAIVSYRFIDKKHGIIYYFTPQKYLSQIIVYPPQNTAIERPPTSSTYIVQFRANKNHQPITSQDILKLFMDEAPKQAEIHHLRTKADSKELRGFICIDTMYTTKELKKELLKNKNIQIISVTKASPASLNRLYAMGTPSLDPEKLTTPTSLSKTTDASETAENGLDKKYVSEQKQQATRASIRWLKLIDEGKHEDSWSSAAEFFRNAVTKEKWTQSITSVRTPLGKKISRKVISKDYATSMPDAPDGEYITIQFKTSFENKADAVETITPMKQPDGTWQISGYYIK